MTWNEVRKLFPNQFVKLEILKSHMQGDKKIVDDMAIIESVNDDNATRVVSLYSPEEGYIKGNLFPELYDEYKDYKPIVVKANDEQSMMLFQVGEYAFAAHELNLYLDLHPDDESVLRLFNDYRVKSKELMDQYENKYGPITLTSNSLDASPFLWEAYAWPFEGGK